MQQFIGHDIVGRHALAEQHGETRGKRELQPQGGTTNLPSQIDPRGLLTFGVAGLSIAAFTWLMSGAAGWPSRFVYLGFASAVLLVLIYLFRLIAPNSQAVLAPAALEGFIVNPLWYVWLGIELRRET